MAQDAGHGVSSCVCAEKDRARTAEAQLPKLPSASRPSALSSLKLMLFT